MDTDAPADGARHRVDPDEAVDVAALDTADTAPFTSEEEAEDRLVVLLARLADLQARLFAQERDAVLVVLQGFDGAGKDAVISSVFRACDPAGCHVHHFKKAEGEEAAHDFLWRFHARAPSRGMVAVFDRSHYEEVVAKRVHDEVSEDECRERYASINDFERILAREGIRVLKFFLHLSKDAQADRVRERLEKREKQADFSANDVLERQHWDAYEEAYEAAVRETSTAWAPWYVIPADHRWHVRVAVAEAVVAALEELDPQWPQLDDDELAEAGVESPDDVD